MRTAGLSTTSAGYEPVSSYNYNANQRGGASSYDRFARPEQPSSAKLPGYGLDRTSSIKDRLPGAEQSRFDKFNYLDQSPSRGAGSNINDQY